MYYEINVSKGGSHVFATNERSITSKDKLVDVLSVFLDKFPEKEGYCINVWYCENTGELVDVKSLLPTGKKCFKTR